MGRTPTPRQDIIAIETSSDGLADASAALNNLSQGARDIMANFNLASANVDVLVTEIRAFQASAVESMFNIGVRLMLLRQISPTAVWLDRLKSVGISEQAARKIVQATIKFNDPRKQRSEQLQTLGKAKLLELLMLDDDSIDVLDSGGSIGTQELDLDEVSRMSPTELRHALREQLSTVEAKDTLIQAKDTKINDLDVKLRNAKKFKPSADSEAQNAAQQAQLDEISSATREVELGFARLATVVADVMQENTNEAIHGRALQAIQYLVQRLHETINEHGFAVNVDSLLGEAPAWLKD